jgi:hypothetical protein
MKEINSKGDYNKTYPTSIDIKVPQYDKRLDCILDIRKFEIELYWKRAAYFWTFIAATFAGYGISISSNYSNSDNHLKFQFILICLGIAFSYSWFLVNKGSKFWQVNWEKHLDLTENREIGSLYKTVINPKYYSSFWNPIKPYAISVSKINQLLSLFVFLIWIFLLIGLFVSGKLKLGFDFYYTSLGSLTFLYLILLPFIGKSGSDDSDIHFITRENIDTK